MKTTIFNDQLTYTNIDGRSIHDLTAYVGKYAKIVISDEPLKKKREHKALKPRIEFLKNMAYNASGERVTIYDEDEENIYYEDSLKRSCYLEKNKEGIDFKYVRR